MKDNFVNILKLAGLAVGGFLGGLPALAQLLGVLMVLDVVTGLFSAAASGVVASEVSKKGMFQKATIVVMVGLGLALDFHLRNQVGDLPLDFANMIAGFYCVHELISILENAAAAGLPVPSFLVDLLAKFPGGNKATYKADKALNG